MLLLANLTFVALVPVIGVVILALILISAMSRRAAQIQEAGREQRHWRQTTIATNEKNVSQYVGQLTEGLPFDEVTARFNELRSEAYPDGRTDWTEEDILAVERFTLSEKVKQINRAFLLPTATTACFVIICTTILTLVLWNSQISGSNDAFSPVMSGQDPFVTAPFPDLEAPALGQPTTDLPAKPHEETNEHK